MPDFKARINDRFRDASWNILKMMTLRQQGKYLTAVLAALAIAEMGQANLPTALASIGSSIGIEALGMWLGKLSEKAEESLDEEAITEAVTQAIEDSNLEQLLQENASVAQAVQQLPGWQSLMQRLVNENQQLAKEILENQNNLTGKVDSITESLNKVATREQSSEIKELLLEIVDYLTQPNQPKISVPKESAKIMANPFGLTGRLEDPKYYLVRQPFTQRIFNELAKGVSLSLVGESQTGKSSLLWYIYQNGPERLARSATDFVYIDMQLIHTEDDFYAYICDELAIPVNRGYMLGRSLKDRQIILCLDEIEKMTWEGFTLNVRTDLRGLADGQNNTLTLIIASRSPLHQLFPDSPLSTSPLANLCQQLNMPPLTLGEIRKLVTQYVANPDVLFTEQSLEMIWQQTQGHPYGVQLALKNHLDILG